MNLHSLKQVKIKTKKRLGRGAGSGKGKTSGRGQKGQKARGKVKLLYEGGQLSLIKRLPLLRGKGRNKPRNRKPFIINLKYLNLLSANTVVDKEALVKQKILKEEDKDLKIKILGEGEITKVLTIKLPISHKAAKKIIAAGGKVEESGQDKNKKITQK